MEAEILKWIAAGGSVTTGLLVYYVYKIEPRLRSLELTILRGQKIALLHLAKDLAVGSDLHESATQILEEVNETLKP